MTRRSLLIILLLFVLVALVVVGIKRAKADDGPRFGGSIGPINDGSGSGGGAAPTITVTGTVDEQVSKHFNIREFAVSASRPDLVEPVPAKFVANVRMLAVGALQPMRDHVGQALYITSGYRSARLNAALPGAAEDSLHMTASAADFTTKSRTRDRYIFVGALNGAVKGLKCGQIIWYPSDGHLHVSNPSATYKTPTCFVHDPSRGHSYRRVSTSAEVTQLGY